MTDFDPNDWKIPEPTEEEIVANSKVDVLYINDFNNGGGKYLNFYARDTDEFEISPQVKIKVTVGYIKEKKDVNRVVIEKYKLVSGMWKKEGGLVFSSFTFEKVMSFIQFLNKLDLTSISERRIGLSDDSFITLDEETKKKIITLLSTKEGEKLLKELVKSGMITSTDITNIGYRKSQLEIFHQLLNETDYLQKYQEQEGLTDSREEIAWQYYFKRNPWIFGYGLDYRFLGILQKEPHLSDTDVAGKDGVIGDYLLGCSKFTVLVEMKKPTSLLFQDIVSGKNRSKSWRLSDELINAVSQILEQKASWQIKAETSATQNFDDKGNLIKQRTLDPKTFLIIGDSKQYAGEDKEQQIKARTFELFKRDSRNVDLITFDELYDRAKFIVSDEEKEKQEDKK